MTNSVSSLLGLEGWGFSAAVRHVSCCAGLNCSESDKDLEHSCGLLKSAFVIPQPGNSGALGNCNLREGCYSGLRAKQHQFQMFNAVQSHTACAFIEVRLKHPNQAQPLGRAIH